MATEREAEGGAAEDTAPQLATREALRGFGARRYATIDLALGEQAAKVRIQSLTAKEMRDLRVWLAENESNKHAVWLALITRSVVDADGARVYQNSEVGAGVFDEWDAALVEQLGMAIDEHVGFSQDVWKVERLEEAAKN